MAVMSKDAKGVLLFECPGCDMLHVVYPEGCASEYDARWTWNNDLVKPTVNPSVLVRYHQWEPADVSPELQTKVQHVCHSFIRDGKIQFLADCTHALASQTVDLPEIEDM